MVSCVPLFATLPTAECQAFWSFTVSWSLFKLVSLELMMLSKHLTLCHLLLLLPSVLPRIRVFSNGLALCLKWPKYWSFSIIPSNEWSQLISLGLTGLNSLQAKGLSRVFCSPTVQKHSSVLSLLYSPTLTSIHDYWKNHSFDYMDPCWKNDVCFLICCLVLS